MRVSKMGQSSHGVHSRRWAELARVWCTVRVVPCNHCQVQAMAWCAGMGDQSRMEHQSQCPGPLLAGQQAVLHIIMHALITHTQIMTIPRIGIATSNILDKNIILTQQSDANWTRSNPLLGNINCVFYTTLDYF